MSEYRDRVRHVLGRVPYEALTRYIEAYDGGKLPAPGAFPCVGEVAGV